MKHFKNIASSENRKRVEKYVKNISRLEKKCRLSHRRDWFVPFLERVYKLHTNWKNKNIGKQRRADLIRFVLKKKSVRKDQKLLHIILEATSTANSKTRSRWANALLAARANHIQPDDLSDFLLEKGKGGIAGRAAEYTAQRKTKKKSKVVTQSSAPKKSDDNDSDWD